MAPTVSSGTQNYVDQPQPVKGVRLASKANQGSASLLKFRPAHGIHQRSPPRLIWGRQYPTSRPSTELPEPEPEPSAVGDDPFVPYTPTMVLHASIIPLQTSGVTLAGTSSSSSRLPLLAIVLIAGGAFVVAVLGLAGVYMLRTILLRKGLRALGCCGRREKDKSATEASDKKGTLFPGDEIDDDPTWGTPTRIVYVESVNETLGDHDRQEPESLLEPSPIEPTTWSTLGQHGSPVIGHTENLRFQELYLAEEDDINIALDMALRKLSPQPEDVFTEDEEFADVSLAPTMSSAHIHEEPFSFLGHEESVSIFRSLQASIDELAKGISSPIIAPPGTIQTRPRQGSDASADSQNTTSTRSDAMECFSIKSSTSSATSLSSTCDSEFDDEELAVVYEAKRAQTQSVELKNGVFVTCRRSSSSSSENLVIPPMFPTFVISEPAPILLLVEEQQSRGTMCSLESSLSPTTSFCEYNTVPSLSSLNHENSRGTICSLATTFSTTPRTDSGWDEDRFLQPPIPYLMVTRPSDSSIYTMESIQSSVSSSVSVDLTEFPLPPIPVKPSYYSRLVDQVQARKQIWENHSADSSVAQKRSTVERFIKMYSSA
ncbi:hypothetical protein DXG03_005933 [Asterophora parasitica]|uniref:Uncharacterized protein n=1 Tax=Asterophora parasitica TaxID=117018 RepID=A0A9P7G5J2_9AGAR|nr:hypothetical protein DXG03_005933 [Asterophora parasitica]